MNEPGDLHQPESHGLHPFDPGCPTCAATGDDATCWYEACEHCGGSGKFSDALANTLAGTRLRERAATDRFLGQTEFNLIDEERKYFWPAGLEPCPDCGAKPALEAIFDPASGRPHYRVVCNFTFPDGAVARPCKMPPGPWHTFVFDAKHAWNLAAKLTK